MGNKRTAVYAGIISALTLSNAATAQENVLEEILVTATKQSLALQDLAGAANVISGERIRPGGVQEVRDMLVDVPSLSLGDQFGFARVFMRGIGMTSIDIGGEGAVAFLQDGAIVPRPAAQLMGMFDLDQVEVLRGPQGTLYGRGATAGAINMVTTKPGDEFGGYANLTVGDYDTIIFQGAVDVPVSDEFSMRAAIKWDERDGYGENKFTGEDVDDRDAQFYRLTLQWDPEGPFDATLSGQYYEEDDNNYAFHYFGPSEGTVGGVPPAVPVLGGRTVFDVNGDFYDINSDQEALNDRDGYLVNLIMNYDFSDTWSLRSITSVQDFDRFLRDDLDSTDENLFGQNNYDEESDSFSQEFIVNYSAEQLDVVGGVMYFEEDLYGKVFVPLTNICFLLAPALCGTPVGDALNSGKYLQDGDVEIEAWGAYAEATYRFNEQWALIAGLRYNYEERDGSGSFIFDAAGLDVRTDADEDWDEWTPRVTLQFNLNDNTMLYGTYTEAFKSGVINTGSLSPPLDPETVDAWELGLKGSSADGRC
jgi:iron complex outermembrane receptor protein